MSQAEARLDTASGYKVKQLLVSRFEANETLLQSAESIGCGVAAAGDKDQNVQKMAMSTPFAHRVCFRILPDVLSAPHSRMQVPTARMGISMGQATVRDTILPQNPFFAA